MKKLFSNFSSVLTCVLFILTLLSSCKKNDPLDNRSNTTVCETNTTESTSLSVNDYKSMGPEFIKEYPFEHFFVYDDSKSIYRNATTVSTFIKKSKATLRVKVTGFLPEKMTNIEETNIRISHYKIEIIDVYQYNKEFDTSEAYMISYFGNPMVQVYSLPTLNINDEYILLNVDDPNSENPYYLDTAMWFKIGKLNDKEYVYPYAVNCSELLNNIPITDLSEAEIYTDPAVIDYMDKNGIEHPKFKYKFELNDFIKQVEAIRG